MADASYETLDTSFDPSEFGFKDKTLKQSILRATSTTSVKRLSSKTQIQWKGVKAKADEDRRYIKTSLPVLGLLASRGYRWHYIHDVMLKIRWEETKLIKQSDEHVKNFPQRVFNTLIRDFGTVFLQKRFDKNAELTLDQQAKLEILKHKVKAENASYLNRHHQIDLLLLLVYTAIFKNQPQDPKRFIATYVHHLNLNRHELLFREVDVPFDQPEVVEEISSLEKERRSITRFAQTLVDKCVNLAMHGAAYVNVMDIIDSLLRKVSPSEESIRSAECAVSNILSSLLNAVVTLKKTDSELVVDEILESILANALPFVQRESDIYNDMRESVEFFIKEWVGNLEDNVLNLIDMKNFIQGGREREINSEITFTEDHSKSILRKDSMDSSVMIRSPPKTRVKFQSVSRVESTDI